MWLMKTLLTSGCTNQRGAGQFRFALFSHSLPKGTVSATINIVALSFMAASVEVARWVYFQAGGRIAFHCLALIAGIVVIMLVSRLLKLRQQHLLQPA
ncbi:hypothetical protein KPC08_03937 [Klebsiella pneumoniae]|nr:hypothetical protein [Klebsiella pneumoniae]